MNNIVDVTNIPELKVTKDMLIELPKTIKDVPKTIKEEPSAKDNNIEEFMKRYIQAEEESAELSSMKDEKETGSITVLYNSLDEAEFSLVEGLEYIETTLGELETVPCSLCKSISTNSNGSVIHEENCHLKISLDIVEDMISNIYMEAEELYEDSKV